MRRAIRISNAPNLTEDLTVNFVIPRNAGNSFEVLITFPEDIIEQEYLGDEEAEEEEARQYQNTQTQGTQYQRRQITLSNRPAPVSPGKDSSLATYGMMATTRTVVPLTQSSLAYNRSVATPSITNNLAPSPITLLSPRATSMPEEEQAEEEQAEEEMAEEEQVIQKPAQNATKSIPLSKTSNGGVMAGGSISEKALMPEEFGMARNSNKITKSRMLFQSSMPNKTKTTTAKSPGKPKFQNETGPTNPQTIKTTTAKTTKILNDAPMIPYEPTYKCQPAYDIHGNATGECIIPPKQNKNGAFYTGGQTQRPK